MIRNLFCSLLILICCTLIVGIDISYASVNEIADNSENVGTHNDIALDSNGFAHICYAEGGGFQFNSTTALKYATNKSGSWTTAIVDNSAEVGGYSSIALDANNKVHISYYDNIFARNVLTLIIIFLSTVLFGAAFLGATFFIQIGQF